MKQQDKFILMTREEFLIWFRKFKLRRKIKLIQNHHTYIPNYTTFASVKDHFKVLAGMEASHLARGFSEIAQNLTTFPDGLIAVCRNFNTAPAGIMGANEYGICIENVGNFDNGGDKMTPEQRMTILFLNALFCKDLKLKVNIDTCVYHHWFDLSTGKRTNGTGETKSCPGTAWFGGNTVQACQQNFIPAVINIQKTIK
jgi:hypothetical protein